MPAAARSRDDMVEGQISGAELFPAILAGEIISNEDVQPVEGDLFGLPNIGLETDDRRRPIGQVRRSELDIIFLEDIDSAGQNSTQRSVKRPCAQWMDTDRLEIGIQDECRVIGEAHVTSPFLDVSRVRCPANFMDVAFILKRKAAPHRGAAGECKLCLRGEIRNDL